MQSWRKSIAHRWGILTTPPPHLETYLWTTRCSRTKSRHLEGVPKQLYQSRLNQYFYSVMEKHQLEYGVISDKYGLHMNNEVRPRYDIHPSSLSNSDKKRLAKAITVKFATLGKKGIAFYNNSPLRSLPYLEMLALTGLPIFFSTNLRVLEP